MTGYASNGILESARRCIMNTVDFCSNIDWEAIYNQPWAGRTPGDKGKGNVEYWNKRAGNFAKKAHHPENRLNAEKLLDRFVWSKNETVLDIGAGPGSFAIPLARRVSKVLALDVATEMLTALAQQAQQEGVNNITTHVDSWLEAPADVVSGFDTMICFNALGCAALKEDGTCHMGKAIAKMAVAARRGMVLVPLADLPVDKPLLQALNMPFTSSRRERVALLFHIMVREGLLPDVEIISRPFFWAFASLAEGVDVIGHRIGIENDAERCALLHQHLQERVETDGDTLILQYPVPQALFKWVREDL